MNKNTIIILGVVILIIVAYGFSSSFFSSRTTQTEGNFLVGALNVGTALDPAWEGFKEGMTDLGYKEGKNIEYIYHTNILGDVEKSTQFGKDLINMDVDLIVTFGVGAVRGAQRASTELNSEKPILFIIVSDPVGNGLVDTLNEPGGNITGVTPANHIVSGRRLKLFKEVVPGLKRVFFPYGDRITSGLEEVRKTAKILGLELIEKPLDSPTELTQYLNSIQIKLGDGILRATDSVTAASLPFIIQFGIDNKIPVADSSSSGVKRGALMGYGPNFIDLGKQGARLADKILTGVAEPKTLPVEFPTHFEFSVNLKTAEIIGVSVADDILGRMDFVFSE